MGIRYFSHSPDWRVSPISHSPAKIYTRQEVNICKMKTTKMWAPLFGLHVNEVISKKNKSERQPTNFIELFKTLRFDQHFSENYVFDSKFYSPDWRVTSNSHSPIEFFTRHGECGKCSFPPLGLQSNIIIRHIYF